MTTLWGSKMGTLTFGEAIEQLKQGDWISRLGWNGKDMYLFIVTNWRFGSGFSNVTHRPFIAMKTVNGEFVPWLASQSDMLETDWVIVNK